MIGGSGPSWPQRVCTYALVASHTPYDSPQALNSDVQELALSAGLPLSTLPLTKVELTTAVFEHFESAARGDRATIPRAAASPERPRPSSDAWARLTALPTTRSGFYVPSRCSPRERARCRLSDERVKAEAGPDTASRSACNTGEPSPSGISCRQLKPRHDARKLLGEPTETGSRPSTVSNPRLEVLSQRSTGSSAPRCTGSSARSSPRRQVFSQRSTGSSEMSSPRRAVFSQRSTGVQTKAPSQGRANLCLRVDLGFRIVTDLCISFIRIGLRHFGERHFGVSQAFHKSQLSRASRGMDLCSVLQRRIGRVRSACCSVVNRFQDGQHSMYSKEGAARRSHLLSLRSVWPVPQFLVRASFEARPPRTRRLP